MNFNDFCKENNKNLKTDNISQTMSSNNNKEDARKIYDKYSGFSNDELMQELIKQTQLKKSDGSLDNKKLNEIQATLSPFLNSEQNKNLKDIMDRLK